MNEVERVRVERVASICDLFDTTVQPDRAEQRGFYVRAGDRPAAGCQRRPGLEAPRYFRAAVLAMPISGEQIERVSGRVDEDPAEAGLFELDRDMSAGLCGLAALRRARHWREREAGERDGQADH